MIIKKIFLAVNLIFLLFACNVESIRKARLQNTSEKQQTAQVDSFLYYQPVALNDSFLDSLKVQYDTEQAIHVRIVPPALPPAALTKQVDGYRVQTFAGLDSLNALVMVNNLKKTLNDTVYFFRENNLFKIQLGDYFYRNDADMKVLDLRKDGFNGAWVVQRHINVPIKSDPTVDTLINEKDFSFKIQILVTADEQKANAMVKQLKDQFKMESTYTRNQNLYKIFLGKFATKEDAEKILGTVRENGYKDAWVVQNK